MVTNYKLFLDDERFPPKSWDLNNEKYLIARTYDEAVHIVSKHGFPSFISFDHDLGEEKTGLDFAKWLVATDLAMPGFLSGMQFTVHSQNPIGKRNIECLLMNYLNKLT